MNFVTKIGKKNFIKMAVIAMFLAGMAYWYVILATVFLVNLSFAFLGLSTKAISHNSMVQEDKQVKFAMPLKEQILLIIYAVSGLYMLALSIYRLSTVGFAIGTPSKLFFFLGLGIIPFSVAWALFFIEQFKKEDSQKQANEVNKDITNQ